MAQEISRWWDSSVQQTQAWSAAFSAQSRCHPEGVQQDFRRQARDCEICGCWSRHFQVFSAQHLEEGSQFDEAVPEIHSQAAHPGAEGFPSETLPWESWTFEARWWPPAESGYRRWILDCHFWDRDQAVLMRVGAKRSTRAASNQSIEAVLQAQVHVHHFFLWFRASSHTIFGETWDCHKGGVLWNFEAAQGAFAQETPQHVERKEFPVAPR